MVAASDLLEEEGGAAANLEQRERAGHVQLGGGGEALPHAHQLEDQGKGSGEAHVDLILRRYGVVGVLCVVVVGERTHIWRENTHRAIEFDTSGNLRILSHIGSSAVCWRKGALSHLA